MRLKARLLWHTLRAGYHWNRMISKQESTGLLHPTLLWIDRSYERSSIRYNESIKTLESMGKYITARSLLRN